MWAFEIAVRNAHPCIDVQYVQYSGEGQSLAAHCTLHTPILAAKAGAEVRPVHLLGPGKVSINFVPIINL